MKFDEACELHSTIQDAAAWLRYGQAPEVVFEAVRDGRSLNEIRSEADTLAILREAWEALTCDKNAKGDLADAISVKMPVHLTMSIAAEHGISTSFALFHIAKELHDIDDLTDSAALRVACERAFEEYENREIEADEVQEGFGWDHGPAWKTMTAHRFDKDGTQYIRTIAKLAGKMFQAMQYSGTTVPSDDPDEVVGSTEGGDLDRLLPSEIAQMSDEGAIGDLKTLDVLENRAQEYQLKGTRPKSRGPMVILIDESNSMADHMMHGQWRSDAGRNTWAKACALALTRIAHAEGRKVVFVHFGTGVEISDIDVNDSAGLWDALLHFLNSGTNIPLALEVGLRQVKDLEKRGFKGADIVLLSDGQDYDFVGQNESIDKMDRDGVDLWTVAIGPDQDRDMPLRKRAKEFVHVSDADLNNPNAVACLSKAALDNEADDDLDVN